jgi:hypothetical protein
MRGVSENRFFVGAFAALPNVRACRLLRRISQPSRQEALSRRRAPNRPVLRTGRELALVLRGRKAGLKGVQDMTEQDLNEVAFAKLDEGQSHKRSSYYF